MIADKPDDKDQKSGPGGMPPMGGGMPGMGGMGM